MATTTIQASRPNDPARRTSQLFILGVADRIGDLRVPTGNRLEKLRGDHANTDNIRIDDQWRDEVEVERDRLAGTLDQIEPLAAASTATQVRASCAGAVDEIRSNADEQFIRAHHPDAVAARSRQTDATVTPVAVH